MSFDWVAPSYILSIPQPLLVVIIMCWWSNKPAQILTLFLFSMRIWSNIRHDKGRKYFFCKVSFFAKQKHFFQAREEIPRNEFPVTTFFTSRSLDKYTMLNKYQQKCHEIRLRRKNLHARGRRRNQRCKLKFFKNCFLILLISRF